MDTSTSAAASNVAERELVITRVFDAPRSLVFKAWTDPEHQVKWMGPQTAFDVIHQCLLTFGHYGCSKDLPHQQRMRDVMGLEVGDGTAGIMKLIIARERIGRAAMQY